MGTILCSVRLDTHSFACLASIRHRSRRSGTRPFRTCSFPVEEFRHGLRHERLLEKDALDSSYSNGRT